MATIENISFVISLCDTNPYDICQICKELYTGPCGDCENTTNDCKGIRGVCGHFLHYCCVKQGVSSSHNGIYRCPTCRNPWTADRINTNESPFTCHLDLHQTATFDEDYTLFQAEYPMATHVTINENNMASFSDDELPDLVPAPEDEIESYVATNTGNSSPTMNASPITNTLPTMNTFDVIPDGILNSSTTGNVEIDAIMEVMHQNIANFLMENGAIIQ